MPNPFYDSVYSQSSKQPQNNSSNLNDIYKLLTQSKNPMQVFSNLAKNNPNMAPIVNLLNNGYSPEQVFYSMCQQRGLNPQDVLKNITR